MEEILVAVLQVILEFGLELLIYGGLDVAAERAAPAERRGCLLLTLFALIGAGLGAVANAVHPRPVLPFPWLRITNLVVGPFLAGVLSLLAARWRRRPEPALHFGLACVFVLGFNLVRFAFARR